MLHTVSILLQLIAPLYLLMCAGRLARAAGILADATRRQLNQLVFYLFAPALIIRIITGGKGAAAVPWRLLLLHVALLTGFILVCMILLRKTRPSFQGTFTQAAYRANMVFFGLPVLALVYGSGAVSPAVPVFIFVSMIYFNVSSVIVLSLPRHQLGATMRPVRIIGGIAANPLIIGCLLGFGLALLDPPRSKWLHVTLELLADCAAPLALIEIGAGLQLNRLTAVFGPAGLCALIKLLLLPALYLLAAPLFGADGDALDCLIILTACPTALLSYLMADQLQGDAKLAADAIVVSSALSLLTIPFWLLVLGLAG